MDPMNPILHADAAPASSQVCRPGSGIQRPMLLSICGLAKDGKLQLGGSSSKKHELFIFT